MKKPPDPAAALKRILASLDTLRAAVLRAAGGRITDRLDQLIDSYTEARRSLAQEFRRLAESVLVPGGSLLVRTKDRIQERMEGLFDARVPSEYLAVRGYEGVHPVLLEYLAQHRGKGIPASRLRVLTGDQVHTERRIRELRDLGFAIKWKTLNGEDHYRLAKAKPDLDHAARFQLEHNLKADRRLNARQKMLLLLMAELGRPVHTARLKVMSGGQTQYDRRIRELRERYEISTGLSRGDIAPDEYVLESLTEKAPHDQFKSAVLAGILQRDGYTCQDCHWSRDDPKRQGRRYLEAHHKKPLAAGGPSTAANGITLCNVCHDARHASHR